MMTAVAEQVESGVTMDELCGIDVPRVPATCALMKRAVGAVDEEVAALCTRVTTAIEQDAARSAELVRGSTLVGTTTALPVIIASCFDKHVVCQGQLATTTSNSEVNGLFRNRPG